MRAALSLPLQITRREPLLLVRFIGGSLLRAALSSATILLIHRFLGAVLATTRSSPEATASLWDVAGLLIVAQLAAAFFTYDAKMSEQRLAAVVELGAMDRLIRQILGLSMSFFDRRTHGELVQSIRQDVIHLRAVTVAAGNLLLETGQIVAVVATAVLLSPRLALWAFLLLPLALLPVAILSRKTLLSSYSVRSRNVVIFDMLLQVLHGIRMLRIYRAEKLEGDRTVARARQYFDEVVRMERSKSLARVALDSIAGVSVVVVVIVGGFQVLSGTLEWPAMLAFLIAARAVHGPINNANTAFMEIQRHAASVASIEAILRERSEIREAPDAQPAPAAPLSLEARRLGYARDGVTILRDVSFEVRSGETLGIVGPSGAGKSTLLNLVARLYDPVEGCITVDGIDLRNVRVADLYDRIAVVAQEPHLFSATVAENIRRGRPGASDDEVHSAAVRAGVHDTIAALPDGYETIVGHGGRALSRGEAQRVNIARALIKDAPILLLDEATSSLDSYSQAQIQKVLDEHARTRIVIAVAHRLGTLRGASKILVLDEGRVAGVGTHQELLADSELYRRLWESQEQD